MAKRSLLTEAKGIPIGITISGANRHDSKLVKETFESIPFSPARARKIKQHICLDAGYQRDEVKAACDEFLYKMHLRPRGEEKEKEEKKERRWVVERTASWMNRFRGILIRWSKKADNYLALLHFACGIIVWRSALCG